MDCSSTGNENCIITLDSTKNFEKDLDEESTHNSASASEFGNHDTIGILSEDSNQITTGSESGNSDYIGTLNQHEVFIIPMQQNPLNIQTLDDQLQGGIINQGVQEYESPGGTSRWRPIVSDELKLKEKRIFDKLEEGILMYQKYAIEAGFDIRRASTKYENGVMTYKYILCNKAGSHEKYQVNTLNDNVGKKKKSCTTTKTDCKAQACFKKLEDGKFELNSFREWHNHPLYTKDTMHLSKHKRKLTTYHQSFIQNASNCNMGATKAHNFLSAQSGGRDLVGPTTSDFKNFSSRVNLVIGESDANILIDRMKSRAETDANFSLDYIIENSRLMALFWADETAKENYKEFSDVLSFDATYDTNKYGMIFVPFTGIDNHRRCVTFGAGLIANETADMYIWLLNSFIKAFGKQPTMVVTDQDPAVRIAVSEVFTKAEHRLCMWHITQKLIRKVTLWRLGDTDFKRKFVDIVWNSRMDPELFEAKWKSLIEEFNLKGNRWLKDLYDIRTSWIPAFFKDLPLSGLMRTTSRSESENNFFQCFMNKGLILLGFMTKFDAAMEKQRYLQSQNDYNCSNRIKKFKTKLAIEEYASMKYTNTIFKLVQKEIEECMYNCSQINVHTENGWDVCNINEIRSKKSDNEHTSETSNNVTTQHTYKVLINDTDGIFKCSCMLFEQKGILCKHIFCVFKSKGIQKIPDAYILRRWQKDLIPQEKLKKKVYCGESSVGNVKMVDEIFSDFKECIETLEKDPDALSKFAMKIKELKMECQSLQPPQKSKTIEEVVESLIGVTLPKVVEIQNPKDIRTKGSGKGGKRLKSTIEKITGATSRPSRKCSNCGENGHNARTCPTNEE